MNKFKNKKIIVALLILGISIGFAALATQLAILGTANVSKQTWDVHWENVNVVKGASLGETPVIDQAGTTVTYEIDLDKPGDTFSFTVDAKNDGSLDAMITNLSNLVYNSTDENTPIDLPNYINYTITYSDGVPIKNNQLLKSKEKETYKVIVKYDEDTLAPSDISLKFKLKLDYVMDDGTGVEISRGPQYCLNNMNQAVPAGTVCKRAETLHQETCEHNLYTEDDLEDWERQQIEDGMSTLEETLSNKNVACVGAGYYEGGSKNTTTITYGTCGTQGSTPVAGDAFDCDVDGNGTFDADERFYYISDSGSNEGYATFIYYKNVGTGQYYSSFENYYGPVALLNSLPSTSEWSNSGLNTGMTRQIKNELGANTSDNGSYTLPNYTYTGRAARLLTTQEVNNACGTTADSFNYGELNACQYLLEDTTYASLSNDMSTWWLENPYAYDADAVSRIDCIYGFSNNDMTYYTNGIRPAIEVDKTKIAY